MIWLLQGHWGEILPLYRWVKVTMIYTSNGGRHQVQQTGRRRSAFLVTGHDLLHESDHDS